MLRNALLMLTLLVLTGCQEGGWARVEITRIALSASDPTLDRLGAAQDIRLYRLTSKAGWFGGISGMGWDGDSLLAVSDVGRWLRFNPVNDGVTGGELTGGALAGAEAGKEWGDAEELARDGACWLVSFERRHRVLRYCQGLDQPPQPLDVPAEVAALPENDGLEAVARLADGRLLLIAEGREGETTSPAWIGGPGAWRALSYPRTGLFRPTGAAPLPDGGILVVERQYTVLAGPAMRLVRIGPERLDSLQGTEILRLAPPLVVDNFEALALRPGADGGVAVSVVSDDNFNPLQSTLMLTFTVLKQGGER